MPNTAVHQALTEVKKLIEASACEYCHWLAYFIIGVVVKEDGTIASESAAVSAGHITLTPEGHVSADSKWVVDGVLELEATGELKKECHLVMSKDKKYHQKFTLEITAALDVKQIPFAADYLSSVSGFPVPTDLNTACGVGVTYTEDVINAKLEEIVPRFAGKLNADGYKRHVRTVLGDLQQAAPNLNKAFPLPEGHKNIFSFVEAVIASKGFPAAGAKPVVTKAPAKGKGGKKEPVKTDDVPPEANVFSHVPPANNRLPALTRGTLAFPAETVKSINPTPATEEDEIRTQYMNDNTWCAARVEEHAKYMAEHSAAVTTRFPPEPNGYLHIGHAKSMFLNFGYAKAKGGITILRFDDTNPEKESTEYVNSIKEDVRWLGHKFVKVTYTSDYFDRLHDVIMVFLEHGLAYVDDQNDADMKLYRGMRPDGTSCPPQDPPCRNNSIEKNLAEFKLMKQGYYAEGTRTVRLKIDMSHDNANMRDPVAYRIKYVRHHHAAKDWCVYPSYDFSHCLIDSFEDITHSMCTLEFEIRRLLYNYVSEKARVYLPMQWEFNRLNITNTVMSKRKLLALVTNHHVRGWDDPRMPTIRGLRRRGFTPKALHDLCAVAGVSRGEQTIGAGQLDRCLRNDLDATAPRAFGVIEPIVVEITNFEDLLAALPECYIKDDHRTILCRHKVHPSNPDMGTYPTRLTKEILIDEDDFRAEPTKGFLRLMPGASVGLRYGPMLTLPEDGVVDIDGVRVLRVTASWDAKPKLKYIHWLSATHSIPAEFRLYSSLFTEEKPDLSEGWEDRLNPESLVIKHGRVSEYVAIKAEDEAKFQLERVGYFCVDKDSVWRGKNLEKLVLNRTVALKSF